MRNDGRRDGRRSLMEVLETRTLLSVSVLDTPGTDPGTGGGTGGTGGGTTPPPVDCPSAETIAADRQKIQDDLAKLATDRTACEQTLQQKRDALNAARHALDTQAAPLRAKLAQDRQTCQTMLQGDRTAIQNANHAGFTTIMNDVKAIIAAHNDPGALKTAQDKLTADRAALQATLTPLLDKLQKDATDCATLLAADQKAINDLFSNDATVKAAQDALTAAQKDCADMLGADMTTLAADQKKLRDDLAMCDDDGSGNPGDDDHDDDHGDGDDDHDHTDDNDQGTDSHGGDAHHGHDAHHEAMRRAAFHVRSPFAG